MKTSLLSLVALFGLICFAQPLAAQKPFNVGVLAGANLSKLTIDSDDGIDAENLGGFVGGAFFRLNIKKLYLQPEALFSMRGTKVNLTNGDQERVRINAFDIPLMVGYKVFDAKLANLRIHGGPVAAFVINEDTEDLDPDVDRFFKRANWGWQFGLGVDVWKFTLDARYELGLNDVVDVSNDFDGPTRNNVFRITLGFKIL